MVLAHPALNSSPAIDSNEVRMAADELAGIIRRVGPDSVTGLVLRQAQQELQSLVGTTGKDPSKVAQSTRPRRVA